MIVGIPKEQFNEEKRVALAPAGVDALTRNGHTVYIQSGAGEGSHFSDEDYEKTGAKIVYTADEIFGRAELVLKVTAPDTVLAGTRRNRGLSSERCSPSRRRPECTSAPTRRGWPSVAGGLLRLPPTARCTGYGAGRSSGSRARRRWLAFAAA